MKLKRRDPKNEADEAAVEDFSVDEVLDAEGGGVSHRPVLLRLQTMPMDQEATGGYWLDTGVIRTTGLH